MVVVVLGARINGVLGHDKVKRKEGRKRGAGKDKYSALRVVDRGDDMRGVVHMHGAKVSQAPCKSCLFFSLVASLR